MLFQVRVGGERNLLRSPDPHRRQFMNDENDPAERPRKTITWQAHQPPADCEHQYEVIAHAEGVALRQCVRCRSLEAE
jgi:hypothetical protein